MNAFQEYFVNVLKTKYFQPQGRDGPGAGNIGFFLCLAVLSCWC